MITTNIRNSRHRPREGFGRACIWTLSGLCILASNGCMTSALWRDELIESFHEPSSPNQLSVFGVPGKSEVLVCYAELSPWSDTPRMRAFYLQPNVDRLKENKAPRFIAPALTNGMYALPLSSSETTSGSSAPRWVEVTEKGKEFSIYEAIGRSEGPFSLPVYRGASGKLRLGLMTPATVAVDATVVGGILGSAYICRGDCSIASLICGWYGRDP